MNALRPLGVAVTGLGCLCALGADLHACLEALFAPGGMPQKPRRFRTSHERGYPVFELPEQVLASLSRLQGSEDILLTARLALAAAQESLHRGGIVPGAWPDPGRVGVCIGTTVGSAMNNEDFYRDYRQGRKPKMSAIHRYLASNPAEVLARELGVHGPVQTVCNACSSGADAIGIAASWIQAGLCDTVLAGGADELCRVTCNGFISLMIHDQQPCRPFDRRRAGLNLGEGAAVLLLESEAGRKAGNRAALGRVLGYGAACDAHHLTAPHPDGRGLAMAVRQALRQADLGPGDLAFVNAHGTGTRDNDRVETLVLARLLPEVPFFSSKGRTGHTLGAAGAIEAALSLGCLWREAIPASAGCSEPDPELPARPVLCRTAVAGSAALSTSLAFGGGNAALVLGR
jgi:3-oxoacyl-(acyl-carrier-protein) synthase